MKFGGRTSPAIDLAIAGTVKAVPTGNADQLGWRLPRRSSPPRMRVLSYRIDGDVAP